MTMIATHHFSANDLWVAGKAIGHVSTVTYRGHKCTVRLPRDWKDFDFDKYDPDESLFGGYAGPADAMTQAAVRMIRVEVEMPGDLVGGQPARAISRETLDEAHRILQESADLARTLIGSLLAMARVEGGQYWLDPQHLAPRVTWLSSLTDGKGRRVPVGFNDPFGPIYVGDEKAAIDGDRLASLLDAAVRGQEPRIPETLLADAFFYAHRASHPNPPMGLVLAAIACESKVKAFLTDVAKPEQKELVEMVIASPREVTLAAAVLFDKGMLAVTGQSMKVVDRELWKAVDLLFQHRNRYAHRGDQSVSKADISKDLRTAQQAFAWLDAHYPAEPDMRRARRWLPGLWRRKSRSTE